MTSRSRGFRVVCEAVEFSGMQFRQKRDLVYWIKAVVECRVGGGGGWFKNWKRQLEGW